MTSASATESTSTTVAGSSNADSSNSGSISSGSISSDSVDAAASTERVSPLHAVHVALGASFTDFGGWQMPVRYSSELDEHHAVPGGDRQPRELHGLHGR